MKDKVEKVIETVRPFLKADGGDIELVEVTKEGVVKLKLTGACGNCPLSTYTLKMRIENKLNEAIPEIKAVEQVF